MTVALKQTCTETHTICMEATKDNLIVVTACPLIDDSRVSYPESECPDHHTEKEKATKTYRRYCKKYGG